MAKIIFSWIHVCFDAFIFRTVRFIERQCVSIWMSSSFPIVWNAYVHTTHIYTCITLIHQSYMKKYTFNRCVLEGLSLLYSDSGAPHTIHKLSIPVNRLTHKWFSQQLFENKQCCWWWCFLWNISTPKFARTEWNDTCVVVVSEEVKRTQFYYCSLNHRKCWNIFFNCCGHTCISHCWLFSKHAFVAHC